MPESFSVQPIGVVHSPYVDPPGTPVQPFSAAAVEGGSQGTLEIFPPWDEALQDIDGFSRVWVLYWCHKANKARTKVVPYRDVVERGLLATRAPARPNPIGISSIRLVRREGGFLHVAELDILDGTPILDIKPYIPDYDSYPDARRGWLDSKGAKLDTLVADDRFAQAQQQQ